MKTYLGLLAAVLLTASASGQTTNAPAHRPLGADSQISTVSKANPVVLQQSKPNEVVSRSGKVIYSGSLVTAIKGGNPLQLLNPFAPAQYGSAEDGVTRSAITGKVDGLKVFGVRF